MTTVSAPNGLFFRNFVAAATTSDLGGTFALGTTATEGPAPGKDTITGPNNSPLVVDTYTPVVGDRILVMHQTAGTAGDILSVGNLVAAVPAPSPVGVIATLSNLAGGTGYNNFPPTYSVNLTGGSGTGAVATFTVAANTGTVTNVAITNGGTGYVVGDVLGVSGAGNGTGFSIQVATLVAPTVPLTGSVTNVSLTGGTGTGAAATLVANAGKVTSVTITTPGSGYVVGDSLTATQSGVGTFSVAVQSVTGPAASQNGIYGVVSLGSSTTGWVLGRTSDFIDGNSIPGAAVFVAANGGTNGGKLFVQSASPVVLNTTALVFSNINLM